MGMNYLKKIFLEYNYIRPIYIRAQLNFIIYIYESNEMEKISNYKLSRKCFTFVNSSKEYMSLGYDTFRYRWSVETKG